MNIEKIEENVLSLINNINEQSFIYDLLLAYDQPKASITRLQKGDYNLSNKSDEVLWKKKLFFRIEHDQDLHVLIDGLVNESAITKHHPRFVIVTDFKTLLSVDTKTGGSLDIPIRELVKHFDFFLPWAGMEKLQFESENPADIKAAERMGRLYDLILEANPPESKSDRHALNIFLSRLLFCFFAEDTGIFSDDQFTNGVASHTAHDGNDLQSYLTKLFTVLNLRERSDYPRFVQDFPYVNGGLFADDSPVPQFNKQSRKIIIECGGLNWKAINPDIFGSMMQAVVHHGDRGSLGMHYTSVVNIMKVIEPLFLNDLYEALEKAESHEGKLTKLLDRLYHLRIFDPACGSGNFLIITYKELCNLEIKIYRQLQQLNPEKWKIARSGIHLTQFYGIELDDFAHETAKLSLWLAEHQMNLVFKEVFGEAKPTLPLSDSGSIVCENSTRIKWRDVCPKDDGVEIYILGNPPYLGSSMQSKEQKEDKDYVFSGFQGYKNLDYIACWFMLGARYIKTIEGNSKFAFVSTNSISQGEQVAMIWPHIFDLGLEIAFAYQSFKWTNNAKGNAGVTCVVVGLGKSSSKNKKLYINGISRSVKHINPYLASGNTVIVNKRTTPVSNIPPMSYGSKPVDGGNLMLSTLEKDRLIENYPEAQQFIKKLIGADELIKGHDRWCLWIKDSDLDLALSIAPIADRVALVKAMRLQSRKAATNKSASTPHKFAEIRYRESNSIIIPSVTSENRPYIPIGFLSSEYVVNNRAHVILDSSPYVFALLSSLMHMVWVRAVAGRLETRFNYSSSLCYNAFPFLDISEDQKTTLEDHVFNVLDEREKHSEKTMAELYDPDKMPQGLRQAHHEMDMAVEQCYRSKPFVSDEERLEYLFKLYEEMIEAEKRT